jgi:hypothetical protein
MFIPAAFPIVLAALLALPAPADELTAEQDHQRLMDLLHITSLRKGADGRNANAPNAPITTRRKQTHIRICPIR